MQLDRMEEKGWEEGGELDALARDQKEDVGYVVAISMPTSAQRTEEREERQEERQEEEQEKEEDIREEKEEN